MKYEKERGHKMKVEHHNMGGHKIEHHHDGDMHRDHHEKAHGHRDRSYHEMHKMGGHKPESMYEGIKGLPMREVHRMEEDGGGRMAKQYRQREGLMKDSYEMDGKSMRERDDTVYGKIPPIPGKIDS